MAGKKGKGMTNKERQQLYRSKLFANPERREEHLKKERERWKRRKEGKKQLSNREIRMQRKKWRESKQQSRSTIKLTSTPIMDETPSLNNLDISGIQSTPCSSTLSESRQKTYGRKKTKRNKSKVYRENEKLKLQLVEALRKAEKYKKQVQRLKIKEQNKNTPRSKTNQLIGKSQVRPEVKRMLLFSNVLLHLLRDKYKLSKSDKEKFVMTRLISSRLIKKYRMIQMCWSNIGIGKKRLLKMTEQVYQYNRSKYNSLSRRMADKVTMFFERDDNSRITTGKNDTLTRNGEKKQRRLLLETMLILHAKYCQENPLNKISYTTFCHLKPHWVMQPTARDRQTCLCKPHENFRFVLMKLVSMKVLPSDCSSVGNCIGKMVCENANINCYLRTCETCTSKPYSIFSTSFDGELPTSWQQWVTINENRDIRGTMTSVKRTVR